MGKIFEGVSDSTRRLINPKSSKISAASSAEASGESSGKLVFGALKNGGAVAKASGSSSVDVAERSPESSGKLVFQALKDGGAVADEKSNVLSNDPLQKEKRKKLLGN